MTAQRFHVSLSFAGEQREFVRDVASELDRTGVKYFYDDDHDVEMWGEDLNEYLQRIYAGDSLFIVMFISDDYARKAFPTVERRAAFAGAMHHGATVLPVRFDDTELPGLNQNTVSLSSGLGPVEIAHKIAARLERFGIAVRHPTSSEHQSQPRPSPEQIAYTIALIDETGEAVDGAEVALVAANGNVLRTQETDDPGVHACDAPQGRLMDVWIAHPERPATLLESIDPATDSLVTLGSDASTGSTIFFGSTGYVPSIQGRFSPILDDKRTYVYIENASVDNRPANPFHFSLGREFPVEEPSGSVTIVRFIGVCGNASLLEYRTPKSRQQ